MMTIFGSLLVLLRLSHAEDAEVGPAARHAEAAEEGLAARNLTYRSVPQLGTPYTSLRLVHWNVANFNPSGESPEQSLALSTEVVAAQLMDISAHCGGVLPDVITLNEDIEFNATSGANAFDLGPSYYHAGACQAEPLWESEAAYANGGRFLRNSMWVLSETWTVTKSTTATVSKAETSATRCAVVAHLIPVDVGGSSAAGVSIATVHLTGGRFTDDRWADFTGEKGYEVKKTISVGVTLLGTRPDIIVGDLNSYSNASSIPLHQASYAPWNEAKTKGEEEGYLAWATEGVRFLEAEGYTRIGIDEDTTKFGGTVDHIFVKDGSPVRIVGKKGAVPGFECSDHSIIYAEFSPSPSPSPTPSPSPPRLEFLHRL